MQEPVTPEEVSELIEDLDQAVWADWGLWSDDEVESLPVRLRAGSFGAGEDDYLEDNAPPETPALQLQRALAQFLGRH